MSAHPTSQKRRLRIWQQNTNRSLIAQLDLLHSITPSLYSVVAIQEPHIDFLGNSRATSHWHAIYLPKHRDDPKSTCSLLLISKRLITTNAWTQIPIDSPDITAVKLDSDIGAIHLYNIYNDGVHSANLARLDAHLQMFTTNWAENHNLKMIWVGDFNRHHPLWDKSRNSHLFSPANLSTAQPLLDLLAAHDMTMVLPKDIPTLEVLNTKNYMRPDNVFCSMELIGKFVSCNTNPSARPLRMDHLPIISVLDTELPDSSPTPRPNFRATDWGAFAEHLKVLLHAAPLTEHIDMPEVLNTAVANLTSAIQATIEQVVLKYRPLPFTKRWWTPELMLWNP